MQKRFPPYGTAGTGKIRFTVSNGSVWTDFDPTVRSRDIPVSLYVNLLLFPEIVKNLSGRIPSLFTIVVDIRD